MSDIDPAAVMAAHAGHDSAGGCVLGSSTLSEHDHCEPYRLAEALVDEQAKVARVGALATPRPLVPCVTECGFCGSVETCDALAPLRTYVYTDDLRAALAGQPEQMSDRG